MMPKLKHKNNIGRSKRLSRLEKTEDRRKNNNKPIMLLIHKLRDSSIILNNKRNTAPRLITLVEIKKRHLI